MGLQKVLMPSEEVRFQSGRRVKYGDGQYTVYVTTHRLLLHKETGMIFKRDHAISWRLTDIGHLQYSEKGLLSKTGFLKVQTTGATAIITGHPNELQTAYQHALGGSHVVS
jgi:hypothetical protein